MPDETTPDPEAISPEGPDPIDAQVAQVKALKEHIAKVHNLPVELADRLTGETSVELNLDASRFARALKGESDPPEVEAPVTPELRALALMFAKQATRTQTFIGRSLDGPSAERSESPGVLPPIETVDGPGLKADRRNRPEIDEGDR